MYNRFKILRSAGLTILIVLALLSTSSYSALAQESSEKVLISLHANKTSVIDILDILAKKSGLNIVSGQDAQNKIVTLSLRDTPFFDALALVVKAAGLGYERIGDSILVANPAQLKTATVMVTRVFELDYANAEEVRDVLSVIAPDVRADVRGNRVIVRANQEVVADMANVIEGLDKKPAQVLLEARLIEVNTTKLTELGVDWEKLTKWSAVLTEGNHGASLTGLPPESMPFFGVGDGTSLYRQASSWEVVIDALVTEGNARLLANSKVVTLDGEQAEIFAGETIPVVITSLDSGGGGGIMQNVQLEYIDVGVRLNITPRISKDGLITTLVQPEVSRITGFVGPDDDLPATSMRRAKTLVRVADGQKIILGGLLVEEDRTSIKKLPILGSLPLLGPLFSHTRLDKVMYDLVIEITPKIIGDEGISIQMSDIQEPGLEYHSAVSEPKNEEIYESIFGYDQ